MMAAAQRHREFIADLSTERPVLDKAQMMRIGGAAATKYTRLFSHKPDVIAVANSARLGMDQLALIYALYNGALSSF